MAAFSTDYSGTLVTFDGRASSDPDGDTLTYAWSFGDGATGSGAVATHRYLAPGSFTAVLTVSDGRGGSDEVSRTLPVGRVEGDLTVDLGDGGSTALAVWDVALGRSEAPFLAGDVVVRFAPGVVPASVDLLGALGLDHVRDLALPGVALFRVAADAIGTASSDDATWAAVRALRARPDVLDAHPNYLLQPQRVPNDPLYPQQWHLRAIGLEAAWDVTIGASSVVVAVLDTGILYDPANPARSHPDLMGQVVPGYDFVSVVTLAGDGDGRDPDPYDPGDGTSLYHGTHVAGTIAARTDEGYGVAGVAWESRILPVRVLGVGGGLFSDVIDGMLWSAGFSVAGVPANAHPARVANLSLGGAAACGSIFQAAIDTVVAAGTSVVVAGGNEATDAELAFPANCANVIAVGATDRDGRRAWYSNHGPRIDVMAPGGDMRSGSAGGVWSLGRDAGTGAFGHIASEGSSQAAAHVAGLIALMLSVEPSLSPMEVRSLLRLTADPLSPAECRGIDAAPLPSTACGAGLVNAPAALASLAGPTPPPPPGELAFEPGSLDFGATATDRTLRLRNAGGTSIGWALVAFEPIAGNPGPLPQGAIVVSPGSGTLAAGAEQTVSIGLDRSFATEPGAYRVDLIIEADGIERRVPIWFDVAGSVVPGVGATTWVGTFTVGPAPAYEITVYGLTTYVGPVPPSYEVLSMGGTVRVLAWLDANDDGTPNAGDLVGEHPSPITVVGGGLVSNVDIVLEPFVGAQELGRVAEAIGRAAAAAR